MATVYVTMGQAGASSADAGNKAPVWQKAARSETITSGVASAAGSLVAGHKEVAQIYCDSGVYVHVSQSPGTDATVTNGRYCKPAIGVDIKLLQGDVITVIDAA